MFDSIIFDLDGTLWDSTVPICELWNVVLKRHAEIKRPPVTINELGECMGIKRSTDCDYGRIVCV